MEVSQNARGGLPNPSPCPNLSIQLSILIFEMFFSQCLFQLVAQMKKCDNPALQLVMRTWCTEGSHSCRVPGSPCSPRSSRNGAGELTHHRAPALIPPDCLTSLPQHFKAFLRLSEVLAASKGKERVKRYLRDRTDSKPSLVEMLLASCLRGTEISAFC